MIDTEKGESRGEGRGGEGRGVCTIYTSNNFTALLSMCFMCQSPYTQMPRSAVGEHLKNSVDHFKHLQLLTKEVKHLRVEVRTLHQWLAQAEAAMQAKAASPASSGTSPDALQVSCHTHTHTHTHTHLHMHRHMQ